MFGHHGRKRSSKEGMWIGKKKREVVEMGRMWIRKKREEVEKGREGCVGRSATSFPRARRVLETRQNTARCRREGMCVFESKGRKSA